ncbi:ribulose-phosphate 3-epimerase [Weeksella virosa]|uniref:Ribulose-phosphate 3-epimerase n=1 Tax=Weeksella virosa (strain ATCC 43766 / DSM 16922 / JCM 21250 / CCUG 30538 / CDC 9751 / IAM 14551 / NBRC 16016 / NCTC 11634 / CL345/78) TaxID=865938 RepID=F0P2J6_WEEVC|nr:ribulose-phosphate 3-epimerase [Weeksella virosa]ADX67835.1 ribulose-phosphate 3-epimerase [Weeksella virosa DSM 16922]VEH64538.1 Ribulose-phosphate 3-epimerase [Weeksella virosa]
MAIIAPSILASDFAHLGKDIEMVNNSQAQWFHLDVMDGVFVPNISYGMPIIDRINQLTNKVLDVHLMIVEPERYITAFREVGADILTVHYEASTHLHRTIQAIKVEGMKAGVALNPHTPVSVVEDIIEELDLVLVMSVNPGFGGQKFIENTYRKIEKLAEMKKEYNPGLIIEVDGGVNTDNAPKLTAAGADALVAGSAVFNAENPTEYIAELVKA